MILYNKVRNAVAQGTEFQCKYFNSLLFSMEIHWLIVPTEQNVFLS